MYIFFTAENSAKDIRSPNGGKKRAGILLVFLLASRASAK